LRRHCPERSVVLQTDDAHRSSISGRCREVTSSRPPAVAYTISGNGEELVTEVIRCLSDEHIHVTDFARSLPTLGCIPESDRTFNPRLKMRKAVCAVRRSCRPPSRG
jgi:hypothetical protein